ncbi:MAG TPA: alanine--tRNA ligase [Saprospiraceae bacterium]|nr:alanine--tRNA ligase [Saprospiraceae bacterium]
MMKSKDIRREFFEFFEKKGHKIVPSAPIVVKDDPTLMFTNAGMNQFKDFFLGNKKAEYKRLANSQKCLRVSGKHNDLEEVGRDSYHHTMFEMLGNWSIGDYFKAEAIGWAWELLVNVYKLPKDRLYASVFAGDVNDGLGLDLEAKKLWEKHLPDNHILEFGRKENFWEMGDIGPCGPCSEIHIDLRSDEERKRVDGATLVNRDNPLVIEIWNLVFIQFNRKADGLLEELPEKHVDTGMGFERLTMALQGKKSNYDTDIFSFLIDWISKYTETPYTGKYGEEYKSDIAMRVISDHLRAVSFCIADGELPSNTGAGYVVRRILRRAVRYYYSFLGQKEPMMFQMVKMLGDYFKDVFPELEAQHGFVSKVILEEEKAFLRTLEGGLKRIEGLKLTDGFLDGKTAFELYDTYGFPIDLTRLIATEKSWKIDEEGFEKALNEQKERARKDAKRDTGDWLELLDIDEVQFVGYDYPKVTNAKVSKYRTLQVKDKKLYQIVLDKTPFYAEGGGQVGDTGYLDFEGEKIKVIDTIKENDLIIHITDKLPKKITNTVTAEIDEKRRSLIENNHSGTHLLHAALREVLGNHVHQKGSLVKDSELRFDFSHYQKLTDEELRKIEQIVNQKVRENISLEELRSVPFSEAQNAGAMMLFGEKYGDYVRIITFDKSFSRELCGGCHVKATGKLGFFKIVSESGIAAGVRRIEAITGDAAEEFVMSIVDDLNSIKSSFKTNVDVVGQVNLLHEENKKLRKEVESLMAANASNIKDELVKNQIAVKGINLVKAKVDNMDAKAAKTLAYNILQEMGDGIVMLGFVANEKPQLLLAISEKVVAKGYDAGKLIRTCAAEIKGGGGGQAFFATAGGSQADGLERAINKIEELI